MRNDESNTEKTCRLFGELVDRLIAKGLLTSGVDEPPRLQLVTDENAHEFSQRPKRRGRKPKPAATRGNVVPIGARATKREADPIEDEDDARLQAFYDRINALPIGALSPPASGDSDGR